MKYIPPLGSVDPNASYVDENPNTGTDGSIVERRAVEHPMREIVAVIAAAGLVPTDADLTQLLKAIQILDLYDIPFQAGWGADGNGEDLGVQAYGATVLSRNVTLTDYVGRIETPPVGDEIILDIERNGVSVFETKPVIADGANVATGGVLDPDQVTASKGDLIVFKILQTGIGTKGKQLTFSIAGNRR